MDRKVEEDGVVLFLLGLTRKEEGIALLPMTQTAKCNVNKR